MKFLKLFVLIVIFASVCSSLSIPYSSWICNRVGSCEVKSGCGHNGGECLLIHGNITKSVLYSSPIISEFMSSNVWYFEGYTKCGIDNDNGYFTAAGTAIGTKTLLNSGWTFSRSFFRVPNNNTDFEISVGVYFEDDTCYFEVTTLLQTTIKELNFEPFGELGHSDKIIGNTYSSGYSGASLFTNYLSTITCSQPQWNGGAFRFYTDQKIEFDHSLKVPFVSNPIVSLYIYNYQKGDLMLSSSTDGVNWIFVGNTSGIGTSSFTLPSPSHTHVKLSAHYSIPNHILLYVYSYSLTANFSSSYSKTLIIGSEIAIAMRKVETSQANITLSLSETTTINQPSDFNSSVPFILKSEHSSTSTVQTLFKIAPSVSSSFASFSSNPLSISPGSTLSTSLIYHLATLKYQTMDLSVVDSTNPSTVFASGILFFWPLHPLLDAAYGELLETKSNGALWWCSSMYKVSKYRPIPTKITSGKVIASAARYEKEAVQLVFHSGASDVTINSITISNLIGEHDDIITSNKHISVRSVGYVLTKVPTDSHGIAGAYWPDPLLPITDSFICPANTNCPFWIHIIVDGNVTEGIHSGTITISLSSGTTFTTTLELNVFNFSIPKHTTLASRFRVDGSYLDYHHVPSSNRTKVEELYNIYMKNYEDHRMSIRNPIEFHDVSSVIRTVNGVQTYTLDFTEFEKYYKHYFDPEEGMGFNTYQRSLPGLGSGSAQGIGSIGKIANWTFGTPEHAKLFTDYAMGLQNELEKLGLLEKTNIMWFDEPSPIYFDFLKQGMAFIKQHAPKLKRFCTEEPREELFGYIDVWCPYISTYNATIAHQRQALGEKVWTYMCCIVNKYLNHHIDRAGVEMRLWMWHTFKESVDGILVWVINSWTDTCKYNTTIQDPYEDPLTWGSCKHFGNGAGRFVYPPVDYKTATQPIMSGPIDSIRWEILRDGNEDLEYFKILKALIKNRPNLPSTIKVRANSLLDIPKTVLVDLTDYTYEPSEMLSIRKKVAEMIVEINTTPDGSEIINGNSDKSNENGNDANVATNVNYNILSILIFVVMSII